MRYSTTLSKKDGHHLHGRYPHLFQGSRRTPYPGQKGVTTAPRRRSILKPEKCFFEKPSIEYLGHDHQPKQDPDGSRQAFRQYLNGPLPNASRCTVIPWIRKLLSAIHSGFAHITTPLTSLTKKDTTWHWDADQQKAFDMLNTALLQHQFSLCQTSRSNSAWRQTPQITITAQSYRNNLMRPLASGCLHVQTNASGRTQLRHLR